MPSKPPELGCFGGGSRRQLFEPAQRASSAAARHSAQAQGSRVATGLAGAPFFADFLWQDKESQAAAGRTPALHHA